MATLHPSGPTSRKTLLYRSILARRIDPLEDDEHREAAVGVERVLQAVQGAAKGFETFPGAAFVKGAVVAGVVVAKVERLPEGRDKQLGQ